MKGQKQISFLKFQQNVKPGGQNEKEKNHILSVQQLNKPKQKKICSLHPNSQSSEKTAFEFSHYLT